MSVNFKLASRRKGFLKTDTLIAAVVLVAAMNVVSMAIHRINGLWEHTRQYQFAINELSNQLDSLTGLTAEQAEETLSELAPSVACQEVLESPRFASEISQDELGTRITLTLAWHDDQPNAPQLSAWLAPPAEREAVE